MPTPRSPCRGASHQELLAPNKRKDLEEPGYVPDANSMTLTDTELEDLFDRLTNIRHESSAQRAIEILKRFKNTVADENAIDEFDLPNAQDFSIISFDLRKLPPVCIEELYRLEFDDRCVTQEENLKDHLPIL